MRTVAKPCHGRIHMASSLPHDSKKCAAPLRLIGLSAFPLLALVPCRAWLSNIGARALLPRPVRRGSHVVVAALPEDADGDGSTDWDKELQRATERLKKKELQEGVLTAVPLFDRSDDWTVERVDLKDEVPAAGTVLLADPRTFLESKTMPAAAARTGWMPSFESRRERARLPVVLITEHRSEGIEGVLLGSWSGKLMGDMGLEHFMTRPLYIGGANPGRGLSMLHSYPEMPGASQLTEDGLAVSSDFGVACDWISEASWHRTMRWERGEGGKMAKRIPTDADLRRRSKKLWSRVFRDFLRHETFWATAHRAVHFHSSRTAPDMGSAGRKRLPQGPGSALRFKFFWNTVSWRRDEVDEMLSDKGIWIPVTVSRDLLLREPDSSFEDPLWVQYAMKAGGELQELGDQLGLFPPS
ncbi:unnamed protein product [Durusdinium trenchii]|uniref:Selenoprotein O n=1 Tax=Durusdinium trenchii TaxID=1381693 RepID=A0ABP0NPG4_9DINO